jgi:hypothetical protein
MYAGVPTVDLGFECSSDDCNTKQATYRYRRRDVSSSEWATTCFVQYKRCCCFSKQLFTQKRRGACSVQVSGRASNDRKKGFRFFFDEKVGTVGDLGVTEVADLEARRGAAVQQRVLQLQVSVANLLQIQFSHY